MQKTLKSIIPLAVCVVFALGSLAQAQDKKVDATGTWTWTMPGRNGGPGRTNTAKLKLEGDKLTGTVSMPGRDGQATETEIADGKLAADEISFTVTREFNGNKFVTKYSGKVGGDVIKGKISFDRNGEATSNDWEAKREMAKAPAAMEPAPKAPAAKEPAAK